MKKLCLHAGGIEVSREQLAEVATPERTMTWTPVAHNVLLGRVSESLGRAGWEIKTEQHAISHGGNRYFGLMDLTFPGMDESPDYGMTVGIRNSHDMKFPAGLCAGSHVFVCDNLAFSAEVKIARKHTRWILQDLPGLVQRAVGRLGDIRRGQDRRIACYKDCGLNDHQAHDVIIQALDSKVIGSTMIPDVLQQWRTPAHPEFRERNGWSLFNAFTEVMKGNVSLAVPRTQKLHGLMDAVCNVAV